MTFDRRVVITGCGAISPFGEGKSSYFTGLREGRSGVRRLSLVRDELLSSQVAAEVPDFDPAKHVEASDLKRVPRLVPMAIGAAREAFCDAGLDRDVKTLDDRRKIGVVIGTGGGGIEFAERHYRSFFERGDRHVTPYCVSSSFVGMLSSEISIAMALHGPSHVLSTGCTSSTDAIGYAAHLIRSGAEETLLTGGADACITQGILAGFCRMKVVSSRYNDRPEESSRPFDRDRDGFVLGEGAWVFVIESLERALSRGAGIHAEIIGYASTCDAYHRVAAKQDGVEPARAMSLALRNASLSPADVDYINLHGTGTQLNDAVETRAVKIAFGDSPRAAMSATKSQIGHPQGACGAAGVMAGVFALREQFVPPTIGFRNADPECSLDVTPNAGRPCSVRHVLCNTIAFGSKNSALVLRRWEGA